MDCPACGFDNPPRFRFCGQCGQRLDEEEAERRQLTVMFFDLVGSTTLSAQLDPEHLRELVRDYQATCNEVVRRYEGHVAQFLGDGILVYFGYPRAHSDDGWRAVSCALSILEAMEQLNQRLSAQGQPRLDLRVGIHTGLVVIGELGSHQHRERLAIGETPNIAARLQGVAGINEVVFSEATRELVQDEFELVPLGPQALKGVKSSIPAFRALGWIERRARRQRQRERRELLPLVGRKSELKGLLEHWQRAVDGQGTLIQLVGQAGIGKTRLLQEFKNQALETDCLFFSCYPEPTHQAEPLELASSALKRELSFLEASWTPGERVQHFLQQRAPELAPQVAIPILHRLLGYPPHPDFPSPNWSPGAWRKLTFQTLSELFQALQKQKPCLMVVEGAEYLDPSSLEWLQCYRPDLASQRVLLVLAGRREALPSEPVLQLGPLSLEESRQMLRQHYRQGEIPAETLQRAEGIPLFLEELAQLLQRPGDQPLPRRLRDFFTAQLDQLGEARRTAQRASVIGRRFSRRLLHVLDPQPQLQPLQSGNIVRATAGRDELFFTQAMMQEASYESLLIARRQELHERLARELQERFPQWSRQHPQLLAHHWERSLTPGEAVPWKRQAMVRYLAVSALREAIEVADSALKQLDELPPDHPYQAHRLEFLSLRGSAWIGLRGYAAPEVENNFTKARQLCQQLGDGPALFPILSGLWGFYFVRGDLVQAEQTALLLGNPEDPGRQGVTRALLGQTRLFQGRILEAEKLLEQAQQAYRPEVDDGRTLTFLLTQPAIASGSYRSMALWLLGRGDESRQQADRALNWARQLNHPHTLAHTLFYDAWLKHSWQQFELALAAAQECRTLATQQSFALWEHMALALESLIGLKQGRFEALPELQEALQKAGQLGTKLGSSWWLCQLGGLLLASGQPSAAQPLLQQAAELQEGWMTPVIQLLQGQPEAARQQASERGTLNYLEGWGGGDDGKH